MSVTVRRAASSEEVAAAGELTAEAYRADRLVAPDDAYLDELADARRRASEAILLVAVVPGEDPSHDVVVGTITLAPPGTSYAETAEPGELELRMLAVAPEAQGRGVAEALMRATVREAVLLGYRRVVLATMDAMAAAQRLYVRLGWTRVPERDWAHEEVQLRVYTWRAARGPGARVEQATWPPVRTEEVGGFTLGVSDGLTRRANCAVLTTGKWHELTGGELDARLARVEAAYGLAGLRPCVRVDDGAELAASEGGVAVAETLRARGYRCVTPTLVLVRDLARDGAGAPRRAGVRAPAGDLPASPHSDVADTLRTDVAEAPHIDVAEAPDEAWLRVWLGPDESPSHRSTGRAILTGAPARYLAATGSEDVVGVVRVAVRNDDDGVAWGAISGLTVVPQARGRGMGRALAVAAVDAARGLGADRVFVQVLAQNDRALALFERLGFAVASSYCYAERDAD